MRVLRILTRPNLGGPMRQAVALWHAQRELGVRTLLAVGTCSSHELEFVGDVPSASDYIDPSAEGILAVPTMSRGITPNQDRRSRRRIRRLVETFRPDVVHTHTSKAGWIARGLAQRLHVPLVAHTYHGLVLRDYFPPPISWALRHVERRLARKTDLNLTVSDSCAEELAAFGVRDVTVVPPAVDTRTARGEGLEECRARAALGLNQGSSVDLVVGFVGRLVPIKRIDVFLDMLAFLPPRTHAVVLGDGPMGPLVQEVVKRRDGIRWLGADPRAPALIRGLDVLVIPSRREGFPLVAVEASAAGVPCVGFDVPGVRDAVLASGGVTVAEERGAAGLAEAVVALMERTVDDPTRLRIERSRAELVARCDPTRVGRELFDLYRQHLSTRG